MSKSTTVRKRGCDKLIIQRESAKKHVQVHYRAKRPVRETKWPCPEAVKWGCNKFCSSKRNATVHLQVLYCQEKKWPCPEAEKYACDELFTRRVYEFAKSHLENPLPCCVSMSRIGEMGLQQIVDLEDQS
jgi:hypothetical protein